MLITKPIKQGRLDGFAACLPLVPLSLAREYLRFYQSFTVNAIKL
jgi:hypothetical protein